MNARTRRRLAHGFDMMHTDFARLRAYSPEEAAALLLSEEDFRQVLEEEQLEADRRWTTGTWSC